MMTSLAVGQNRNSRSVLSHQLGRRASPRQHDDEFRLSFIRGPHGRRREALERAHRNRSRSDNLLENHVVVERRLSFDADLGNRFHRDLGVGSRGALAAEHDAVHAVEESVRHVGGFGSRWSGGFDHGLEHLSGCDHRFAREVALVDHHLLSQEDLLYGYLHPKIAASDHERVRFAQDLVKVQHSFLVLNLSMIQTGVFKT